jgi:DNA invertase Pin-like site-specific DNA recombinase
MLTQVAGKREAAIYTRQSKRDDTKKDKQKKEQAVETTLDTQYAACKREAIEKGFTVSAASHFSERYTGAEMWDRPVLSEMRSRIKAREFGALIVYSTDRLARDPIHLGLILEECQRSDCELIFVIDPIEDSPEGQLILYIKGYSAKIDRLRIKDRMARGRNAITAAGRLTCQGNAPYGYAFDTKNRVRVIDEDAAVVVRMIFQWTIEGVSGHSIAGRLRTMGIASPAAHHGKVFKDMSTPMWSAGAVSRILKDESYTGKTLVNKFKVTETRDKKSGRYHTKRKDRSEWQSLPEGVTPALVSPETFAAASKAVDRNRRKAANTRNKAKPFLLREIAFCGACDKPLYPMSESTHRPDNPNISVYKCSASRHKSAALDPANVCRAKRIKAAYLETVVWDKVLSIFTDPDTIAREVEKVLSNVPDDNLQSDLTLATKQLDKTERVRNAMFDKWKDAVADGDADLMDMYDKNVAQANSDMKALRSVIEDLQSRINAYGHAAETARAFQEQIAGVLTGMQGEFTFDEKRAALTALNVRVFALADKPVRIRLNTGVMAQTLGDIGHKYGNLTVELTLQNCG